MDSQSSISWYSLEWFKPSQLSAFTWEHLIYLYLLFAVPVIFILRWLLRYQFNQKLPVALDQRDLKSSATNLVRLFPDLLMIQMLVPS